jgi:hypothetical protein
MTYQIVHVLSLFRQFHLFSTINEGATTYAFEILLYK